MKKSILAVAGLAAVAGVAGPVAGVFAADNTAQTDTIAVTVDPVCTFKATTGIAHTAGSDSIGTWSGDTLSGKMTNGSTKDNFGSTAFIVVCNDHDGWEVKATTNTLAGATSGESIEWNATHSATVSGVSWTVSQAADHGLTIPSGKQGAASSASVAKLASATELAGKTFTVTYGVGVDEDQAADTYTGSIVYALAAL